MELLAKNHGVDYFLLYEFFNLFFIWWNACVFSLHCSPSRALFVASRSRMIWFRADFDLSMNSRWFLTFEKALITSNTIFCFSEWLKFGSFDISCNFITASRVSGSLGKEALYLLGWSVPSLDWSGMISSEWLDINPIAMMGGGVYTNKILFWISRIWLIVGNWNLARICNHQCLIMSYGTYNKRYRKWYQTEFDKHRNRLCLSCNISINYYRNSLTYS